MADYNMVYVFGEDTETLDKSLAEEGRLLKDLLGGKGANLAIMTAQGLPVPPGFTVTVDTCNAFSAAGQVMPEGAEMFDFATRCSGRNPTSTPSRSARFIGGERMKVATKVSAGSR